MRLVTQTNLVNESVAERESLKCRVWIDVAIETVKERV